LVLEVLWLHWQVLEQELELCLVHRSKLQAVTLQWPKLLWDMLCWDLHFVKV
jgi:hypothetical protein